MSSGNSLSLLIVLSISIKLFVRGFENYPSIITFSDINTKGPVGELVQYHGQRELKAHLTQLSTRKTDLSEDADYILPICCSMVKTDVISYQCQNSLATSPKDLIFKRRIWIAPKHLVSSRQSTKFKLESSSLNCKYNKFTKSLSLGSSVLQVSGAGLSYFTPDGYLKYNDEYFRPDEYCISGLNNNQLEIQVCQVNCSDPLTPCIQKCCGKDQIYSFGLDGPRGCVDSASKTKWFPTLYHNLRNKLSTEELIQLNPHIIHKFPTSFKYNCRFNKTTVFPHGKGIADFLTALTQKNFRNLPFRLRKDGWLIYPSKEENVESTDLMAKQIDNYCIDGAQDYGESTKFSNLESETVLFLCSGGVDEAFDMKTKSQATQTGQVQAQAERHSTTLKPLLTQVPPSIKPEAALTVPESAEIDGPEQKEKEADEENDNQKESSGSVEVIGGVSSLQADSDSASVEIEIEDDDNSVDNSESIVPFIPAVLKTGGVQVSPSLHPIPQPVNIVNKPNLAQILKKKPALAQTTFNHNNNNQNPDEHFDKNGANKFGTVNPANLLLKTIPTCCNFSPDVNDGFTHHCRNRRMDLKGNNLTGNAPIISYTPIWNVPPHFMSTDKSGSFSLRPSPIICGAGKFQFQGFIHNFEQERAKNPGEKKHGILSDAFLKYENEFYSPDEYCVNGLSPRIVEVLICKPDCSMWETPCIRKCCGLDEIYNLGLGSGNRGCQPLQPSDPKFQPTLFQDMNTALTDEQMKDIQPHFIQKYPPNFQHTCFNKITLAFPFSQEVASKLTPADSSERGGTAFKHLNFRFRKDGKLMYSYPESDGTSFDSIYDRGEFCVDAVRDYGEKDKFQNHENQTILFICASEPHSIEQ